MVATPSAGAVPGFSVPFGASLVFRAKPFHYIRRAAIAAAARHVIDVGTAAFNRTREFNEYALTSIRRAR